MSKEEVADKLDEYSEFLRLDGQSGRAHAYERAARSVRMSTYIPADPSRLDNVGDSTRETIIDLENGQGIEELDDLRDTYSWYDEFKDVKFVGPSRAKQIKETLGVETLDKLSLVAKNGDLQLIDGIGPATAEKIEKSIERLQ